MVQELASGWLSGLALWVSASRLKVQLFVRIREAFES